ncbi:MAG: NPCBM/NEW2 domain-containing protein [Pirellulaceae bacterium]
MTPIATAFVFAAATLAADVSVRPLAGDAVEGKLMAISGERIVIETPGGSQTLAASDLLAIDFEREPSPDKPTIWLDLLDGSKLLAESYRTQASKATVGLVQGAAVEIPTRSILAVRFRQQDSEVAEQWREIVDGKRTSDLIVIRKTSMRVVENGGDEPTTVTQTVLDVLDGALLEIGPESVKFDFAGDQLDVKREKIEGLVYFHPVRRELTPALCRLTDVGGSRWSVKSIELKGETLSFTVAAGATVEMPLAAIAKLDYSVGNVALLSELAPDTGDGEPIVSLQPGGMTAKFGRIFQVSSLPPLGADGFRIGGKRYASGLSLHSPATLVYRVPAGFHKLHAVAGVDDSIVTPGQFVFQILGDGKELFRHAFGDPESRGPVLIDLDLTGVRRISIVVDPADGQDIGDQLNLCDARLTK